MPNIKLTSKSRWRATAAQARMHGGMTVTEFWAEVDGKLLKTTFVGFGPTPSARHKYALNRVEAYLTEEKQYG